MLRIMPFRTDMVSYDLFLGKVKNWNLDPKNKLHVTPHFPAGSFTVRFGDYFRSEDHLRGRADPVSARRWDISAISRPDNQLVSHVLLLQY